MIKFFLGFILLLATVIRLTTLSKLMVFNPDEEYLLYLAQTLIKDFHIIWIGVSTLGFDLYMGPFWIYIIYPLVAITKGDPLVLGIITSLLGVLTTFLLYWLGKEMFNNKVGLIASLLYATSALIVYYDQQPYPPAVPFLSVILALSLYMTRYSNKWWLLFAASYGMVFHIHLSLILIIFVAIYWGYKNKKSLNKKVFLLSFLTFILMVSPLIAFDYFHKASNITTPIRILQSSNKQGVKIDFSERFYNLSQTLSRIWYLDPYKNNADEILYPCIINKLSTATKANWVFSVVTIILLIYFAFRKETWKDDGKKLLTILGLSFIIPFLILPIINPIEYYLLGFFPILILIIASTTEAFTKPLKYAAYLIVIFLAIYGIFTVINAKGDYGLDVKKKIITQVMNTINGEPYDLKEEGLCHKYEGWRYLFSVYGRKPERSSEDEIFSWLYPGEISNKPIKYSVIINESRAPITLEGYQFSIQEGGFTAYIFEH